MGKTLLATIPANAEPAGSTELQRAQDFLNRLFPRREIRRVLLVNPPDADLSLFRFDPAKRGRYGNFPPYGLAVLAQHLRSAGIEVRVSNLNHEVLKRCSETEHASAFDFAATWQGRLERDILDFEPDLVGVTCMFTMTHASFRAVCARVAAMGIPLAIGGVHVTNDVERVLDDVPWASVAFVREADLAVTRFVQAVNRSIDPDALGQVIFNDRDTRFRFLGECVPDSDDISVIPAFDLTDASEYSRYGTVGSFSWLKGSRTRVATVLSNRGCRARCTFCSVRNFNGPGVRQRSVASVLEELQVLRDEHGIDHVMWLDDDLLRDHARAIAVFNEMVRRDLRLTWDATNGVIAASCTEEVIAAAAESGCIGMGIGMESGNREILRRIRKPGTVETFLRAAEVFRRHETIVTSVYLIIGFPGETMSMISDTIDVARAMNLDWYRVFHLQPLPNTPIYDEMVAQGLMAGVGSSETRYIIGAYGKLAQVEARRLASGDVGTAFHAIRADAVPTDEQLVDIWFYMDYHLNYQRLLAEARPVKIEQQMKMLRRVSDVIAPENGFALYFLAYLQRRLYGAFEAPIVRRLRQQLDSSSYWATRFRDFGLSVEDLHREAPAGV